MSTDRPAREGQAAAIAIPGGELELGGGLLALLRPALDRLEPGGVLSLLASSRALRHDLPAWCRVERHPYLGYETLPTGQDCHRLVRGPRSLPSRDPAPALLPVPHAGRLTAAESLSVSPMPERADPRSGFAPRDLRVEPGGPLYPFTLLEREHVAPPEVAMLYDQAVGATWDGSRDIPWHRVVALPPDLDAAVGQLMTFLAENELSALYVPARWLPRIHPAYVETSMFLASQLADEARHIDVFLKRARMTACGRAISSVATSHSLHSLLESADFTEATFLLSVLGEGTFLDLLRFIEAYAPDEATAELARRAHADETRHVHFGLAHVRHALAHDPGLYARLESAVRTRAARLAAFGGVPAPVQDALTLYAARGGEARAVARGHEAFRALLGAMHEGRMKRLRTAGFTVEQAQRLSDLHTPNFM